MNLKRTFRRRDFNEKSYTNNIHYCIKSYSLIAFDIQRLDYNGTSYSASAQQPEIEHISSDFGKRDVD